MSRALHAEWTKRRTVAATGWLLLGAVTLTVALGLVVTLAVSYSSTGSGQDITKLSLTGVYLGQAVVAILAVTAIAGEYGTGMMRVTLAAMPRRTGVLAAKAAILSALVLAAGAISALASVLIGRLILPGRGFDAAHGYQLLSLSHGPTLRAAAGSVLYLALIALLSHRSMGWARRARSLGDGSLTRRRPRTQGARRMSGPLEHPGQAPLPEPAGRNDLRTTTTALRASDDDREHTANRLRHAAAKGRLLAEELEHRLEAAFSVQT